MGGDGRMKGVGKREDSEMTYRKRRVDWSRGEVEISSRSSNGGKRERQRKRERWVFKPKGKARERESGQ